MFCFRLKGVNLPNPLTAITLGCASMSQMGKTLWQSCIAALGVQSWFLG